MAVKIITDSASDISESEAKALGITMLPMSVRFGEEEFFDGVSITPTEFYEKLIESDTLPKTSQVTPFMFERAYAELTENGDEVIVITISSKLSGTYQSAKSAALDYDGKVFVVDSLNAAIGERLLCEYALSLIKQGKGAKEVASELEGSKGRIRLMALLNTLEYLKKGGRISAVTAFAGEVLGIKPVIAVIDGEVKLVGKARGSKNGENLLNELVKKSGVDFDMPLGTIYSGTSDHLLNKYIEDSVDLWKNGTAAVSKHVLGATIGTHVGPNAIGVAFFAQK